MRAKREHITAAVFILLLGGLCVANFFYTPPEISQSERRRLRTLPAFSVSAILDGQYRIDFERYAPDAFIGRDSFRSVKAAFSSYLWLQTDNNDVFARNGSAAKLIRLDESAAEMAADKIRHLATLMPESSRFYYAVIPDKGYYMQGFPKADYERLDTILSERLSASMTAIDLRDAMKLSDFYHTDLHWDQSRLPEHVLPLLTNALGISVTDELTPQSISSFQGVYAGQLALPMPYDDMTVLQSPIIDGLTARYLDPQTGNWRRGQVYNKARADGIDPYDVFLDGAQPLIVLENPNAEIDRELVLFRDSFGSSLAPLLAASYRQVTVIDMRYLSEHFISALLDFGEETEVLFLYSLQSINIAGTWKVGL